MTGFFLGGGAAGDRVSPLLVDNRERVPTPRVSTTRIGSHASFTPGGGRIGQALVSKLTPLLRSLMAILYHTCVL